MGGLHPDAVLSVAQQRLLWSEYKSLKTELHVVGELLVKAKDAIRTLATETEAAKQQAEERDLLIMAVLSSNKNLSAYRDKVAVIHAKNHMHQELIDRNQRECWHALDADNVVNRSSRSVDVTNTPRTTSPHGPLQHTHNSNTIEHTAIDAHGNSESLLRTSLARRGSSTVVQLASDSFLLDRLQQVQSRSIPLLSDIFPFHFPLLSGILSFYSNPVWYFPVPFSTPVRRFSCSDDSEVSCFEGKHVCFEQVRARVDTQPTGTALYYGIRDARLILQPT